MTISNVVFHLQAGPDGEPVRLQDRAEEELPTGARDRLSRCHREGRLTAYTFFY
jgi:hypothetical protein